MTDNFAGPNSAISEGTLNLRAQAISVTYPIVGYEVLERGDYVLIEVSDTGAGIPKEDQGKIFEPFFTSKKRTRTNQSGSGLGLSVGHGVVKDHGGHFDLVSAVGVGTTFKLYFPSTEEEQAEIAL